MSKAPYWKNKSHNPCINELKELASIVNQIGEIIGHTSEIYIKLIDCIKRLENACQAEVAISRGGTHVGYGLKKSEKAIACDQAIAVIRQIKAMKAW